MANVETNVVKRITLASSTPKPILMLVCNCTCEGYIIPYPTTMHVCTNNIKGLQIVEGLTCMESKVTHADIIDHILHSFAV